MDPNRILEVHIWGRDSQVAKIDVQCLAIAWYLSLTCSKLNNVKLITSCNGSMSPTGRLPVLVDYDPRQTQLKHKVVGYLDIVRYLETQYELTLDELSPENRLINEGAIEYILKTIETTTMYTLFVNKENYEGYSRSIFSQYLPFPMQYSAPLFFRKLCYERCQGIGLLKGNTTVEEDLDDDNEEYYIQELKEMNKKLSQTGIRMGGLYERQQRDKLNELMVRENTLTNMRCIYLLGQYIETVLSLQVENIVSDDSAGTSGKETDDSTNSRMRLPNETYSFGNKLSSCDILLFSCISILTFDELPNKSVNGFVTNNFPKLVSTVKDFELAINHRLLDFEKVSSPTPSQVPTLTNTIKSYFVDL
ncbi:BA75_01401T0 [Komagataella pastoris]|uniref:BA75_01401T0 n=1 Tax=Komagataella pastoris TaxID=4922 RepID=A0A1B2J8H6_PICPA|nr:BA75_01401T0 [Komagataella pastoris]